MSENSNGLDAPRELLDMTFAELVSSVEAELAEPTDVPLFFTMPADEVQALVTAVREQQAALVDARNRINEALESEGPMEAGWSKEDREFVATVDAVLAKWRIE